MIALWPGPLRHPPYHQSCQGVAVVSPDRGQLEHWQGNGPVLVDCHGPYRLTNRVLVRIVGIYLLLLEK